jgi:Domain of unknown function (DUF4333)
MRARPALFLPLLVASVAVTGCSKTIDAKKGEKFITKQVEGRIGIQVKTVKCPSGLTAKKGATFDCTVTATDGSTGKAQVTEKDAKGNVTVRTPFISPSSLEKSIASGINQQAGSNAARIGCPDIIEAEKGGKFDCQLTAGKQKLTVKVTQTDNRAHVRYRVVQ